MNKKMLKMSLLMVVMLSCVSCARTKVAVPEPAKMEPVPVETVVVAPEPEPEPEVVEEAVDAVADAIREEELKAARDAFFNQYIYFAFDKASLDSAAQEVIAKKKQWMEDNPGVGVIIEGHADRRGSRVHNQDLGRRRALAVQTYLVFLGVDSKRLSCKSLGEDQPVAQGNTEADHALNRRVECKIYALSDSGAHQDAEKKVETP